MVKITLFVPGLLGPDDGLAADVLPALPALSTLLSKASRRAVAMRSRYRTLYALMGFTAAPGYDASPDAPEYTPQDAAPDIPVAAVTRRIDQGAGSDAIWLRADPVCLLGGRNGAVMLDEEALDLGKEDALALAAALREGVASIGWELEAPVARRWYLRLPAKVNMRTVEPERLRGDNVLHHLPKGDQARDWHRLMNDMQMLLHGSAVNQRREQAGRPVINSVWLWGMGAEPAAVPPRWDAVYSADVFLRGLAQLAGTPCHVVPESLDAIVFPESSAANILIDLYALYRKAQRPDLAAWRDALLDYEQRWFAPLLQGLRRRRLAAALIHAGAMRFYLNRMCLLFFWRRARLGWAHPSSTDKMKM